MIMASFLAVHRHSVLMLFAFVALTLFACSGSDDSETNHSSDSSYNDSSSSSEDLSSSSSSENSNSSSSSETQIYTVTYNANGGTNAPDDQAKTHDENIALSNDVPTKTGHTFIGWNTHENGEGTSYEKGASYTANADVTLYAQWTITIYTVSYNANSGTDQVTVPAAQIKTYDEDIKLSDDVPTRTGYIFYSWNTQADGKGLIYSESSNYAENENVTLYAIWNIENPKTLKVTVYIGGTVSPSGETLYFEGTEVEITATANSGYKFSGWSGYSTSTENTITVTMNENITLHATFEDENSSVEIDGNGEIEYYGQKYKTFEFENKIWMAENLNYNPNTDGSSCYDNDESNCAEYGRLYNWATVMNLPSESNYAYTSVSDNHQGLCPSGWHIPNINEFNTNAAKDSFPYKLGGYRNYANTAGTVTYPFSGIGAGSRFSVTTQNGNNANYYQVNSSGTFSTSTNGNKLMQFYVRCVKNENITP